MARKRRFPSMWSAATRTRMQQIQAEARDKLVASGNLKIYTPEEIRALAEQRGEATAADDVLDEAYRRSKD